MSASNTTTRRSCDELGVCQGHTLRCARCLPSQPFAPGVITVHRSQQRRALQRWLRRTAALMGAAIVIGLLAGIVFGVTQ